MAENNKQLLGHHSVDRKSDLGSTGHSSEQDLLHNIQKVQNIDKILINMRYKHI